jgi:hypothetical protein
MICPKHCINFSPFETHNNYGKSEIGPAVWHLAKIPKDVRFKIHFFTKSVCMGNVIDFTAHFEARKAANSDPVVNENPFLTVRESGELEYTQLGLDEWQDAFEYAGIDIRSIQTIKEHAEALESVRFEEIPPFSAD